MFDAAVLKKLHKALRGQTLLFIEDKPEHNIQVIELFQYLFETVVSATDGEEGLELFRMYRPSVVISDIQLSKMDGFTMGREILKIDPETKLIFLGVEDSKETLHEVIKVGAFDFLHRPLTAQAIVEVFARCAHVLRAQMHRKMFYMFLDNIFNYQQNLVLLLHHETVVMANQPCFNFFGTESIDAFQKRFLFFGDLLLPHNGFLYNHDKIEWLRETKNHPGKLFNVKIADKEGKSHHFVLHLQIIPDKENYYVLSLNDVTELNLLKLYDAHAVEKEELLKDKKALHGLLEMAKRNNVKVKVHNLYKGLSITNDGLIDEVEEDSFTIKTTSMQVKAIQFERKVVLVSEIFPMFIESCDILKIHHELQKVTFGEAKMTSTSPTRRQYIRVPPNEEARVTLLYEGHKFNTDVTIADISIKSCRLFLATLPPGIENGSKAIIDMVLGTPTRPLIVNTEAEVLRITMSKPFEVVFTYELHTQVYRNLIDYIAKRQMNLIREFKGMQNG